MDKRSYNLVVGAILIVAAVAFLVIPAFLPLDPMIPVLIAIVCFVLALVFFFSGNEERTDRA